MAQVKMQKIPYFNSNPQKTINKINNIANMSDEEIIRNSAIKTYKEARKSPVNIASKLVMPATIGALILDNVAKTKGAPSVKLAVGLGGLASWAILSKSFGAARKASIKAAQNVKNDNTKAGLAIGGTLVGGTALYMGASTLIGKGIKFLTKKMPGATRDISKLAAKFDNSFNSNGVVKAIKKNIGEPLKNIATKHPKLTKTLAKNSKILIIASGILAAVGLAAKASRNNQKAFDKNTQEMLMAREEARQVTNMQEKSQARYDKIPEHFYVNNEPLIKTVEFNPINIDNVTEEIISDAIEQSKN